MQMIITVLGKLDCAYMVMEESGSVFISKKCSAEYAAGGKLERIWYLTSKK